MELLKFALYAGLYCHNLKSNWMMCMSLVLAGGGTRCVWVTLSISSALQ